MSDNLNDALRALIAEVIREALPAMLAEIAPQLAARADETIDAARFEADGLGTRRQFADAAGRGAFATFKGGTTGRARIARRADVLAWLAMRSTKPRSAAPANDTAEPTTHADAYDAIVQRAG